MSHNTYKDMSWSKQAQLGQQGVLTGCDFNQEWLLPLWWRSYIQWNRYPVCFLNFGMTPSGRYFCAKRGKVIDFYLPKQRLASREDIPKLRAKFWDRMYPGDLWQARPAWFAKPCALLKTPFQTSIWIDLDGIVQGNLSPLFSCLKREPMGLVQASKRYQKASRLVGLYFPKQPIYNTGVMLFRHGNPILKQWAQYSLFHNEAFFGDEHAFNHLLFQKKWSIVDLKQEMNWPLFEGENHNALILHYLGSAGKQLLLQNYSVSYYLEEKQLNH